MLCDSQDPFNPVKATLLPDNVSQRQSSPLSSILSHLGPTNSGTSDLPQPEDKHAKMHNHQRRDYRAISKEWIRVCLWLHGHPQCNLCNCQLCLTLRNTNNYRAMAPEYVQIDQATAAALCYPHWTYSSAKGHDPGGLGSEDNLGTQGRSCTRCRLQHAT